MPRSTEDQTEQPQTHHDGHHDGVQVTQGPALDGGRTRVLRISGVLDASTPRDERAQVLARALAEGSDDYEAVVLDLTGLEHLDSAGITNLVRLHRDLGARDVRLQVVAGQHIRHLLAETAVDALVRVYASLDERPPLDQV